MKTKKKTSNIEFQKNKRKNIDRFQYTYYTKDDK